MKELLLLLFTTFTTLIVITACTVQTKIPPTPEDIIVAQELPTATLTPLPTATFTPTPIPTETSTFTPSPTPTPSPSMTPSLTYTPSSTPDLGPETIEIGRSVNNASIDALRFGVGSQNIIFVGGLHAGFAPGTVALAQQTGEYFANNLNLIPDNVTVYIISSAGPDSLYAPGELSGRLNANGVDLNRNWDCNWISDAKWRGNTVVGSGGPIPFSEVETQYLRDFIIAKRPVAVIFWEARAENGLASPGSCGTRSQVSESLATTYGLAASYPVSDFEELTDQIVNGDGANWLDKQGIPAITVLLPQYTSIDWENNMKGILAVLQMYGR